MTRNRIVLFILALAVIWSVCWYSHRTAIPAVPIIIAPESIDLGECEAGQIATAEFEILNDGTAELHIAGVRSTCSCAGLESKQPGGQYSKVNELTIAPGERKNLVVRLAVNGPVGGSLRSAVNFQTDDPNRPEVTLRIQLRRIRAGAYSIPLTFAFGTVPAGQPVVKIIDVIDSVFPARAVDRIGCSNPDRVKFTRITVPEAEATTLSGQVVERLRIEVSSSTPGDVDERVNVWLVNEAPSSPVSIRVVGRVAPAVEFAPKTLVLSQTSDKLHKGSFLCLTHGRESAIRVLECPVGFTAQVADAVAPTAPRRLIVTRTIAGLPANASIRVGVTLDGVETVHTLQVRCSPDPAPEAP